MGVHLEDGWYIFRCTLVEHTGLQWVSTYTPDWSTYKHRDNPRRAIRARVIDGAIYYKGQDWLDYYMSGEFCYSDFKFITELDQLQTGLLPYPERS